MNPKSSDAPPPFKIRLWTLYSRGLKPIERAEAEKRLNALLEEYGAVNVGGVEEKLSLQTTALGFSAHWKRFVRAAGPKGVGLVCRLPSGRLLAYPTAVNLKFGDVSKNRRPIPLRQIRAILGLSPSRSHR